MIICPNLSNPEVAKEFNEIKDAIEAVKPGKGTIAAYLIWSLNNGNSIDKAPNGAESVLFNSLLEYYNGNRNKAIVAKAKTYSTNFLKWFGNWTREKDALPEYEQQLVSKIVDENGEPRVIFHTTRLVGDPNFETFDTEIRGFKSAIYGSDDLNMSLSYMSPDEAEFMLDSKYNYTPNIPLLVELLQKDFPEIDWYNFDYDTLPLELKENKYVNELYDLLELNDLNSDKIEHNISVYRNSVIEYEINAGDHFEYRYKTLTTPFTKALFYNIKNPIIIDARYKNWNRIDGDSVFSKISNWKTGVDPDLKDKIGSLYYETADGLERKRTIKTRDIEDAFRDTKYDGVIIENVRDYGGSSLFTPPCTVYIAYKPNQVKHADNRDEQYTGDNIYHNLSPIQEDEELKQISLIFDRFPELDEVGTPEQYYWYILSIFPNSKDKRIYWHGSDADFSDGLRSAKRLKGSGAPETKNRNDFYLARQAWTVLLYVSGVNRKNVDKNGFSIWNKLWFEFKEIMVNGRRENTDWKNIVINENTVRQAIPNKEGVFDRDQGKGHGKWLKERKADYGYENKSDKEFFEEILGVNWGEDTFNTWTRRNAMIFKQLLKNGEKGIYPVVIDVKKPIREVGQDTYYEEHRGLMTKADKEGYDTILSEKSDNEFNSDIAVVINVSENRIHFLGSKDDIKQFKDFVREHPYTEDRAEQENSDLPYEPYVDEESKPLFQRLRQLEIELQDVKLKQLEINTKLAQARADTISKNVITVNGMKMRFVEKPNKLVYIDTDSSIFSLVSVHIHIKGDAIESLLLFPSRRIFDNDINYNRIENSIKENTVRIIYELLSVLKDNGLEVVRSPWMVESDNMFTEEEYKENATIMKSRMSRLLGINVSNVVTSEETIVMLTNPFSKETGIEEIPVKYYRMVFNVNNMLSKLTVLGHNKDIYDILNSLYKQPKRNVNNNLLIKALLDEEKHIYNRRLEILDEIKAINDDINRAAERLSGLPFNKTQGSLIWLVRKAIKDGLSKSEIDLLVNDLNYENNSNIKVNWKTKEVFGDKLLGTDDISRTNDRNVRRIEEVVNYLNAKFGYRLAVEYMDEDTWLRDDRLYNGSNSCIIGDVIYLRRSRMTTEIAAEEMLHTFIHGMKMGANEFGNRQLFDKLFKLAKQQFPKLWDEIQKVYKYNHDEELVTQVLARYFNRDFDKRDAYKLEDLIEKFKNWFIKLFNSVLEEFAGTYYAKVSDVNPLLDFLDISDMLLAKNLRFDILIIPEIHKLSLSSKTSYVLSEDLILHNISARQQAAEKEALRLTVRMNILYREYEKIKSKTPSQERLANLIFETYNKLKQHMDISSVGIALEQARLTLGQYDRALDGPAVMLNSNIYKYLYDMSKQDYQGMTPDQLVDMYRNSIKFYKDLIEGIPSDRIIDLTDADKKNITDISSLIDRYIMPLWTEAIIKVGDDIVDALVDQEVDASDQDKADMKEVAKDWLHKNIMYGDLNAVSNYVYNYSYSSNPIIKQAFHLIQHAEQKTLEEMHHIAPKLMRAYQAANKGIRSVTPGWQSMMMEYDLDGKPTGNFIRDINYGQYNKDLINFIKTLNSDFIDDYGFTYVVDDTGATVNSLTGEYAEDEEWGPNGEMPKYVEYLRAIESFKAPRVHRRFVGLYYLERLTRPYDGTIDPLSPEFKDSRFNHGLSPKTLKRYNYYLTNINYYYNKCQDPKTGLIYPERLNSDDRLSLRNWEKAFDKFKDIFNEDGSYKSGEDLKMAYEVRAWQKWIGEKTNSTRFQDVFNSEENRIRQECLQTGDMRPYNIFLEHNASMGINPDYIEQTVGSLRSHHKETDESYRARILRKTLLDAVKQQLTYGRRLLDLTNNPLFWLHCKASDQAIDDARDPNDKGISGWTPQQVEAYKKKFYDRELLYTNPAGNYIDENGVEVQPNTQQAKNLEDAGKLLTVRQWLINHYTDEALRNGFVQGLIDESTGNPISFSGMTATDIKAQIINLLSYRKRTFEEDGSITEEYVPLTIFSMLWPKEKTFLNKRTGKKENTIVLLGEGRFKESYSSLTDTAFNPNEGIAEKPDVTYENGRYDNAEKYNEMRKDQDVAALYDLLIETMQNMQSIYSTNRKFNYKLPLINAQMSALFSRIIKRGYSEKSLSAIWNAMTNIEANDDDMRTKEDYFVGVDGEVANNVPLKFIRNLKNPEDISTDLVSSVIMFADMAINYKNKTAIDSTLKLLRYNMDEATRMTEKKKYVVFGRKLESNEYSKQMFDAMLDSHMYGNQWSGKNKTGGPSRAKIATFKTVDAFLSLESSAMLGLNFFSMSVGFGDALTRIFSESVAGKYMTPGDCLFALGTCLWYTPACIKNMFNPVANNKLTALMQMNGISKGIFSTYTKADWGKGRKFAANILMGGWSMLDWMANALLMVAFYHNCRFYDGGEIPTGFYTKYEMQQAFANIGKSKHYANYIHHNWSNYGNRVTLWDAYGFDGKGEVFVKTKYELYVTLKIKTRIATKTKKRGALYNGMNPDNDVPQWKRDVIGRLVGALRGWIPQQLQHLFAGGTDNIVRTFEDVNYYDVTTSGTRKKVKSKKVKLTDEERSRRFAWDYETGTTQDQIMVGLYRSIGTLWRNIKQWAHLRPGTAKLSEVEKYAMKDAVIFLAMLSLMMVGWTYVHDWAREVPKPKNRYEAGPMSAFNPVDYYNYIRDVYIPNEYWRLAVDDVYFRIVEAKISNINPQQVLDIVNAATALKSGLDDQLGLLGLGMSLINNDEDADKINKQGAYKFYTQGERDFYRGIGFLKNIHTFLTYEGATNNLRWYTNKFGKFYRLAGYDFKAKDKKTTKQKSKIKLGGISSSGGVKLGGIAPKDDKN